MKRSLRYFALSVLIVAGIFAGLEAAGRPLRWNRGLDFPVWLYWVDRSAPIARGDVIAFRFPGDLNDPKPSVRLMKVGGTSGDQIRFLGDRAVFVNGRRIDRPEADNRRWKETEPALYDGPLPPASFFLLSDQNDAYDSRYFGLISREQLLGKVLPLL